jgi:hypothetical protein
MLAPRALQDRLFHENRTPFNFQTGSIVLAETSALTAPQKSVRPLAGPGKPMALRLARQPAGDGPRLTRPAQVGTTRPRAPHKGQQP